VGISLSSGGAGRRSTAEWQRLKPLVLDGDAPFGLHFPLVLARALKGWLAPDVGIEAGIADLREARLAEAVFRTLSAPGKIGAGKCRELVAQVEEMVVVSDRDRSFRNAELRQFQEVGFTPNGIQHHSAVTVKTERLVRESGNAAELMDAVEEAVERIVVALESDKFTSAERDRVTDLGSAWLLLPWGKDGVGFLVTPYLAEGVLAEESGPVVSHLQNVADMDVLGSDPSQNFRVVGRRAAKVDVIVGGVPAAGGHIHPAFQPVLAGSGGSGFKIDGIGLADVFQSLGNREGVDAGWQTQVKCAVSVERAIGLNSVSLGTVLLPPT